MAKKRKLAVGSFRDHDWQAEEYRRQMGEEAAERQRSALPGACICHKRTLKTGHGYRTIHTRSCPKYKDWMNEYQANLDAQASAAAHAAAARREVSTTGRERPSSR